MAVVRSVWSSSAYIIPFLWTLFYKISRNMLLLLYYIVYTNLRSRWSSGVGERRGVLNTMQNVIYKFSFLLFTKGVIFFHFKSVKHEKIEKKLFSSIPNTP